MARKHPHMLHGAEIFIKIYHRHNPFFVGKYTTHGALGAAV